MYNNIRGFLKKSGVKKLTIKAIAALKILLFFEGDHLALSNKDYLVMSIK